VLRSVPELLRLARQWSELDVISSLAWLALEQKYCRPTWSHDGALRLKASRHPVVEQERRSDFIPNDLHLVKGGCLLLTGPNMAGKSTLMRQVALTVILAQMGSFVPAEAAELPLVDRLFTRIGASDHLSEGLSTFMVEMKETAEILKWATPSSLVILDEIGRGTSTYDGMSLAQAILEHLVTRLQATSLFATHYHELTLLSSRFPNIQNAHMSIREKGGEIHFLHLLQAGPANKSYGIHVAKLAGLPSTLTHRASQILQKMEWDPAGAASSDQMSLMEMAFQPADEKAPKMSEEVQSLVQDLRELSVQELTPLEALNRIAQWQRHLS
jgi:DNA mismatch repair protein MutS